MRITVKDLAEKLGAEFVGDQTVLISRPAEPAAAKSDEIALAMDAKYSEDLQKGEAVAAILWPEADWKALGLKAAIFAPRSRYILSGVNSVFELAPEIEPGIHPTAVIHPNAKIGEGASVGPFVLIGNGVSIGKNARIFSHCSISEHTVIGDDVLLHSGVRIGPRVEIGDGFIAQPNATVGADGFSYVSPEKGIIEDARSMSQVSENTNPMAYARINSLGTVIIGDNVELGACSNVDRGTISNTTIGNGTKMDNLVQIGHNCSVGENCLLCGQVGVAGSVVIENNVVLAGQVGVADHVRIGENVVATGQSGVVSNVPPNRVVMGNPAVKMELGVESYKAIRRLPRIIKKFEELQKLVSNSIAK